MTQLGFWAGGYQAHLTYLRERYTTRKTRLAEMLSRRERPDHQERLRELIQHVEAQFLDDFKNADRLLF